MFTKIVEATRCQCGAVVLHDYRKGKDTLYKSVKACRSEYPAVLFRLMEYQSCPTCKPTQSKTK